MNDKGLFAFAKQSVKSNLWLHLYSILFLKATAFVMGNLHFRFTQPSAITSKQLTEIKSNFDSWQQGKSGNTLIPEGGESGSKTRRGKRGGSRKNGGLKTG